MKRLVPGCVAATLVLLPAVAQAGGIEVPDLGAKSLGRGSAFAARADDLSAFYYNPAGLSKSKGINVHLGINLLHENARFSRRGSDEFTCLPNAPAGCDTSDPSTGAVFDPMNDPRTQDTSEIDGTSTGDPYAVVRNQKPLTPVPTVVFSYGDVGKVEGLAIAAGVMAPSAFGFPSYDEEGAQRYALREAEALLVYPGVGISYRINRYISIGGVFLNGITHAKFHQAARGTDSVNDPPWAKEESEADADFAIEVRDWFSPVGIIGLMSHPIDQLEIGASVRTPVVVDAQGSLTFTPSEEDAESGAARLACDENSAEDGTSVCDGVAFRQTLPWILRVGARYVHERFDVEVDYVFEAWSATPDGFDVDMCDADDADSGAAVCQGNDPIEVEVMNLPGAVPVFDTTIPKNFRDVHSIRLGSDVAVIPRVLDIRAGGWWQSSAYPENYETFSVDFPVAQQFAVTAGLTWHAVERKQPVDHKQPNWLDVTVGYSHVFQPTVTVTEGIVQQQGIRDPDLSPVGNVVNNGVYQVSFNVFGLALEGHF